jgi:hypothetical protein
VDPLPLTGIAGRVGERGDRRERGGGLDAVGAGAEHRVELAAHAGEAGGVEQDPPQRARGHLRVAAQRVDRGADAVQVELLQQLRPRAGGDLAVPGEEDVRGHQHGLPGRVVQFGQLAQRVGVRGGEPAGLG